MAISKPDITAKEIKLLFPTKSRPSLRSIQSYLTALGFIASKSKVFEYLTDDQKESRIRYCEEHCKDKFSNVLFTDQKPLELFKYRRKVWRKSDQQVSRRRTTKYPPKIQIWGGISKLGKTRFVLWKT